MKSSAITSSDHGLDSYVDLYAACLANPAQVSSRVPDAFKRPTALVHSRQVIDIPIASNGNWAVCVQPKLGGLSQPLNYKCAVVAPDESGNWPVDLSVPASFLTTSGTGDPRLDPNASFLTQPIANYTELIWTSWSAAAGVFDVATVTTSSLSHGLPPVLAPGANPRYTQVTLSGGAYLVTVAYATNGTWIPGFNVVTDASITSWTPADADVSIVQIVSTPNTLPYNLTAFESEYVEQYIVAVNGAQGVFSLGSAFGATLPGAAVPFTAVTVTFAPIGSATTSIVNTFGVPTVAPSTINSGIVQQLRPVAMSALVTYMGPTLNDGGQIAVTQVQGSTVSQQFFVNSANSLANFNIAAAYQPAINHDLRRGAYVYWTPESSNDTVFHRPSDANDQQYPALVICGNYRSSVALSGTTTGVLRCQVDAVFEFTTTSQLFVTRTLAGSQAALDAAWLKVASMPQVSENPQHGQRLKAFFGKLRTFGGKTMDFYRKNKAWIDPAVGTLLL